MNADERRLDLDQLTRMIIGCVYRVSNTLGVGFLEKVYENALAIELRNSGLMVEQQHPLKVSYRDFLVGVRAAGLSICLLVNFGRPRTQIKRIVSNF
jgi:PD-(D/E)XK nuclease superfamily